MAIDTNDGLAQFAKGTRVKVAASVKVDFSKPEYEGLLQSIHGYLAAMKAAEVCKSKASMALGCKLLDEQKIRGRGFIKSLEGYFDWTYKTTQNHMSIAKLSRVVSEVNGIGEEASIDLLSRLPIGALLLLAGKKDCLPAIRAKVVIGLQTGESYDTPKIKAMINAETQAGFDTSTSQPTVSDSSENEVESGGKEIEADWDTPLCLFQKISPELGTSMGTLTRFATEFSENPHLLRNALTDQERTAILPYIEKAIDQFSTIRGVLAGEPRSPGHKVFSRPGFRGYVDQAHRGPQHPSLALQSGKH